MNEIVIALLGVLGGGTGLAAVLKVLRGSGQSEQAQFRSALMKRIEKLEADLQDRDIKLLQQAGELGNLRATIEAMQRRLDICEQRTEQWDGRQERRRIAG